MRQKLPPIPRRLVLVLSKEEKEALARAAMEGRRPADFQAEQMLAEILHERGYLAEVRRQSAPEVEEEIP